MTTMRAVTVVTILAALVAIATSAAAGPFASVPRPIRLEGAFDRTRADPRVIGEITISAGGRESRRFGVTAVQAYKPEEEGMQIFRFTSDHPATLIARGDAVGRLFATAPDRSLTVFGTYTAGSGLFVVGSVDVAAPEASPSR